MKYFLIAAMAATLMAGSLSACGGASDASGPITAESAAKMAPSKLAGRIIADMTAAGELVNGIQTVADAEAAKAQLGEIGERYTIQMTAMRNLDQSRIKDAEKFMQKQMEAANALSGFVSALTNLQMRNVYAATVVMPELKHFRPS